MQRQVTATMIHVGRRCEGEASIVIEFVAHARGTGGGGGSDCQREVVVARKGLSTSWTRKQDSRWGWVVRTTSENRHTFCSAQKAPRALARPDRKYRFRRW